ncbi:cupin domain-containing protein [Streptococcus porcinus]|uniref:Mannose-6-phosphate isomerase n=2 Tax=Streptococcus porcinus TaxID=1340 RepID=A0A4V0H6A0_STRPO|nr:cupin domain-containing protein [Streptococcus porcinus]EGJ26932.1 cupin domain protein [Streptococcus porcinus str. Jelinkova 176]SQG44193.1 Mannose-6-phosphate isomerase [Streptococcus porcinus]VTT43706.1 Mannose-6-phosphate isomerase [Streptococcus porcinus]VTT45085.1 Mannose-6-phosphate isomerase [Streptococcus porcinus]
MTFDYKDHGKEKYIVNIEDYTKENENYRTTIWTGEKLQVTLMAIQPGDDIGLEVHKGIDQFLRIEEGKGLCQMGDAKDNLTFKQEVSDDDVILVPADTWHNVTNIGDEPLKIYSIYAGPDHVPGTIHKTHEDAKNDPNED